MNSGLELKCTSKCLGILPKNQEGGIDFRIWVKRINSQHLLILLDLCVVWRGSVKCSFSVCSVISLFSCLAVNNCIGNMLDFPEFWHLARSFLNQSDCRTSNFSTEETNYIKHVTRYYRGTRHSRNQLID